MKNVWIVLGGLTLLFVVAVIFLQWVLPEITFRRLEREFLSANPGASIVSHRGGMGFVCEIEITGEVNDISMFRDQPLRFFGMNAGRINFDLGELNVWKLYELWMIKTEVTRPETFAQLQQNDLRACVLNDVKGLTDLSFLKTCTTAEYLDLTQNKDLRNFAALADVQAETLILSETNITEITGILNPKLRYLDLQSTAVVDITPATSRGIKVDFSPLAVPSAPSVTPLPSTPSAPPAASPPAATPVPYFPPVGGK